MNTNINVYEAVYKSTLQEYRLLEEQNKLLEKRLADAHAQIKRLNKKLDDMFMNKPAILKKQAN